MSAVSRVLGVALLAAGLSGCVAYPYPYYAAGDPNGGGGYYYGERYDDGYGGDYGYVEPYDSGYSAGWPAYYSTLWPVYRNYYDPFWSPGFYYGVTWFPSTYFGIGIGGWDAWPYYTPYSPYRYSFWDSYYAWYDPWYYDYDDYGHGHGHGHGDDDWDGHGGDHGDGNGNWRDQRPGHGPRYGSARNEAERMARLDGAAPVQSAQSAQYGNARGAAGRNWRGAPPQGSLSETSAGSKVPLSNADLYGGARFAGRPGAAPRAGNPAPGYREDASVGYAPGAGSGGARGEGQRMGAGPGYPQSRGGNPYNTPRGNVQAPANPDAGWVGPASRSRPTGYPGARSYEGNAPAVGSAPQPRNYSRQVPQQDYTPIEGSTGGESRWRSAPPSASTATPQSSWNRPATPQRGVAPGSGGYDPRARQPMPQGQYPAQGGQSTGRFSSRAPSYDAPQQRYQAPPSQPGYQAQSPQPRYQAPAPQPRSESPPPRESSRDNDRPDNDGGSHQDSGRFDRGGRGGGNNRDRED